MQHNSVTASPPPCSKRGHSVHVIAAPCYLAPSTHEVRAVSLSTLASHRPDRTIRICPLWEIWSEVGAILDEVRPDVVHRHYIIGRPYLSGGDPVSAYLSRTTSCRRTLTRSCPSLRSEACGEKITWRDMRFYFSQTAVIHPPDWCGCDARPGPFNRPVMPVSNGLD